MRITLGPSIAQQLGTLEAERARLLVLQKGGVEFEIPDSAEQMTHAELIEATRVMSDRILARPGAARQLVEAHVLAVEAAMKAGCRPDVGLVDFINMQEALIAELRDQDLDRIDRIGKAFPASWLDPLLTGPDAVIKNPPYGCPDLERVLLAVKAQVLQAFDGPAGA